MYYKKAMNEYLGPTAQYWNMYVHMVKRVHRDLMRALQTNDVDGYINRYPTDSSGAPGRGLFQKTHGKEVFTMSYGLGTVNRDAASPMIGIVGFHYSLNAIRIWCLTSTQCGMSVTELRRLAGLETIEQPAMQLRVSRNHVTPSHRQHQHLLVP